MRCIRKCLVAVCFLVLFGNHNLNADMVPGPAIPEKPAELQKAPQSEIPAYSIGAGIVALSLLISLIALRTIREKNDK